MAIAVLQFSRIDCTLEQQYLQVETFSSEPVQLVKLRNPMGPGGEYVGAWAREALDWDEVPPQEKERLAVRHMGDGEFW
jgi:hypothetical protein